MADPDRIASFLLKSFAEAVKEFDLLAEGDRIAVAVSGGKDSRALLDLLLRYRERVPYHYDLVAVHVTGSHVDLPDVADTLVPWLDALEVDYRLVPLDLPPDEPLPLDCFRCTWNRRKALFLATDEWGCNKLAFGHHADDAAVTSLLNLLFGGRLETLEPSVVFFDRITLIRPMIYLEAKELARYARAAGYPAVPSCPRQEHAQRDRVAAFLRSLGPLQTQVRANLWRIARGQT